jgi:hypothetical protein
LLKAAETKIRISQEAFPPFYRKSIGTIKTIKNTQILRLKTLRWQKRLPREMKLESDPGISKSHSPFTDSEKMTPQKNTLTKAFSFKKRFWQIRLQK